MPDSRAEIVAAKQAIRRMLAERPRPTQVRIAAATGLTQSRVAKINKCSFERMSSGVRKVVEYSRLGAAQRVEAETRVNALADRIKTGMGRLAAADPALGEAVAEFIEKMANSKSG
jgi:hypothetical protein